MLWWGCYIVSIALCSYWSISIICDNQSNKVHRHFTSSKSLFGLVTSQSFWWTELFSWSAGQRVFLHILVFSSIYFITKSLPMFHYLEYLLELTSYISNWRVFYSDTSCKNSMNSMIEVSSADRADSATSTILVNKEDKWV